MGSSKNDNFSHSVQSNVSENALGKVLSFKNYGYGWE